jgi:hypothetical protein
MGPPRAPARRRAPATPPLQEGVGSPRPPLDHDRGGSAEAPNPPDSNLVRALRSGGAHNPGFTFEVISATRAQPL